jgi:hypothetical protein
LKPSLATVLPIASEIAATTLAIFPRGIAMGSPNGHDLTGAAGDGIPKLAPSSESLRESTTRPTTLFLCYLEGLLSIARPG